MTEIVHRGGTLVIHHWLDDNSDEFIGQWTHHRYGTSAAYGWSKGAGYYLYTIGNGHIEKIGTVKRELIEAAR